LKVSGKTATVQNTGLIQQQYELNGAALYAILNTVMLAQAHVPPLLYA
jgi:hypothetical protein